jgi:hypothetical protein
MTSRGDDLADAHVGAEREEHEQEAPAHVSGSFTLLLVTEGNSSSKPVRRAASLRTSSRSMVPQRLSTSSLRAPRFGGSGSFSTFGTEIR